MAAAVHEDSGSTPPTTAGVAPGSSSWMGDNEKITEDAEDTEKICEIRCK